ncbi:MAG: hypothetical protein ACRDGW_10485, partial [Actinomycetota bacterium]
VGASPFRDRMPMIFGSGRRRGADAAVAERESPFAEDELAASTEDLLAELDTLVEQSRTRPEAELDRRMLKLRHLVGLRLTDRGGDEPEYPEPAFDRLPSGPGLPEFTADELSPELVRAALLRDGCILIRGLIEADEAGRLAGDIDRAFDAREAFRSGESTGDPYYEDFVPDPRFDLGAPRMAMGDASNLWGPDSPRVMAELFDTFERTGLGRVATGYLGERPAVSMQKCTLRRVFPDKFTEESPSFWHQDGAFLGHVRALNMWLSLSRCGDVAPGLDIVPRRIDHIVPTGTKGAVFKWSVSQDTVDRVVGDSEVVRPVFEPGDGLLFDELFLHATGADPGMPDTRYAVECWLFGPSAYPRDYAPLVL